MKRIAAVILSMCLMLCISACSGQESKAIGASVSVTKQEQKEIPLNLSIDKDSENKILIAYFTWAENTYVKNSEAVDVDATSSASVLLPGNTAKMVSWIQHKGGGDLFSIKVTEPYSSDYDECLDRAADEKAQNARPALVNHIENMDDYDVIFLGYPNWWYTVPMPVLTFIEEYDLSDKTIPFCAHGM